MAKALKVLILEDNPADAELIQFELSEAGFTFIAKVVMTENDFIHEIQEYCPDLILSDYDLPTYNGALALAETIKKCPDTPFILVTGAIGEDRAIEILTQGAKDYVLKNRLQQRLITAVKRALAEAEEHRARKKAEAELREAYRILEERVKIRTAELEAEMAARTKTEEGLRESEERFRKIFEEAPLGIVIISPSFVFEKANPTFCRMMGYSEEELRSMTFADITHSDYIKQDTENMKKVGLGELPFYKTEKRYISKSGKVLWGDLIVSSIHDEHGALRYYLSLVNDITDRKMTEEEKRSLEERLQRVEKMEAIGTLAGGIAHSFNNLLMGIQGYASLTLLDLEPSHPHYKRMKRIEDQVQSGADLAKQLLGFAQRGRYDVKPDDMNEIIKKTSAMFGRAKKEIAIHRKYGKDLWTVEVDSGQMEQIFMNLFMNSWQAMPGGGEITLETENVVLEDVHAFPYTIIPGKYVKITVSDTGMGMDMKTVKRIFEPFFTTREMGRGTGLGLATVYGIIKGHKGMINVYSEPGHGTTFTIYLPASEKEAVREKTATGTIAIARGAETILLVDDEQMVLEVSKNMLEYIGYRVYAAGNGQEAIAVYMEKRSEIDLVLLDMILPGMSGGETFDHLREIDPEIRVLLYSGYSIEGEAQQIMDRRCNGFIQKPFQLKNLSQKIRAILDGNNSLK